MKIDIYVSLIIIQVKIVCLTDSENFLTYVSRDRPIIRFQKIRGIEFPFLHSNARGAGDKLFKISLRQIVAKNLSFIRYLSYMLIELRNFFLTFLNVFFKVNKFIRWSLIWMRLRAFLQIVLDYIYYLAVSIILLYRHIVSSCYIFLLYQFIVSSCCILLLYPLIISSYCLLLFLW